MFRKLVDVGSYGEVVIAALLLLTLLAVPSHAADWRPGYEKNTGCNGAGVAANDFFAAQSDGNGHCVSQAGTQSATYIYAANSYTAYATPTDMVCLIGSATKTVRVNTFVMQAQSTSATFEWWYFVKRSTPDTGGTNSILTPMKADSSDAAATAVLLQYTAAPSLGTAVGNFGVIPVSTGTLSAAAAAISLGGFINSGGPMSFNKPVILRGTNDELCINLAGVALPSGFTASFAMVWTEY